MLTRFSELKSEYILTFLNCQSLIFVLETKYRRLVYVHGGRLKPKIKSWNKTRRQHKMLMTCRLFLNIDTFLLRPQPRGMNHFKTKTFRNLLLLATCDALPITSHFICLSMMKRSSPVVPWSSSMAFWKLRTLKSNIIWAHNLQLLSRLLSLK